jgi:hypothetical protein
MADNFRAMLVTKDGDQQIVVITAISGKAPIIRKFPLIPGIESGRVLRSEDPRFQPGDRVVANGFGLGEAHHGGYAERACLNGDWLIKLPDNISTAHAMAIGTAGFIAMLCMLALEKEEISPDKGDVLVTGAGLLVEWARSQSLSSTSSAIASSPRPVEPSRKLSICGDSVPTKSSMLAISPEMENL